MREKMYVGVDTIMRDYDISRPKAYAIIQQLNKQLKEAYPTAIIIAGKVNRNWYDIACLKKEMKYKQ